MNYWLKPYRKEHIKAIRILAQAFSTKLIIRFNYKYPTADVVLEYSPEVIELKINNRTSIAALFSAFFHELGHVYCKDHKIYPFYHYWDTSRYNKKERANLLRICLRAEIYADKIGEKIMKEYYPEIPFIASYTRKNIKDGYAQELKDGIKRTFEAIDRMKRNPNREICHSFPNSSR